MLMCWLLLLAGSEAQSGQTIPVQKFQRLSDPEYLTFPYSMVFSPQGRLYVVDQAQPRILVWNKDGSFYKGFVTPGQGPGEMERPVKIGADKDRIYVWEYGKFHLFDHDGNFIRFFQLQNAAPRQFAVLGEDRLLVGFRHFRPGGADMVFQLRDLSGAPVEEVKTFNHEGFITSVSGDNNVTIRGYPGEIDLQRDPEGNWYFGFSQTNTLYRVDAKGKIVEEKSFPIPTAKPTKEEIDRFMNRSFPGPNGVRMTLKDFPNLRVDFSHEKAYYTNFTIVGDKVVFALTPIGSTDSVGNGYSRAQYNIHDFKTGKWLSRGQYAFPEDSVVLYRDGRIVAFVIDEEGVYSIQEIKLPGL